MSKIKKISIGVIVVIAAMFIFGSGSGSNKFEKLNYPDDQGAVIKVIADAQTDAKKTNNDMQKGNVLHVRTDGLCSIMDDLKVDGWVGLVKSVSSNSDGLGVVSLEIANKIFVKTWNNSISDILDDTLIKPTSSIFGQAVNLKPGQSVIFSGTFFRANDTCLKESSLTLDGKLRSPNFIFRFSDIRPL